MASVNKTQLGGTVVTPLVIKLTRGYPAKLGTVTASGDVVSFSLPEPSYFNQAGLVIQVAGGTTPTFALEVSIDGGATWATFPTTSTDDAVILLTLTGQPGGDPAATFMAKYFVDGMASALFRFGRTDANGGNAVVWALVG
jgi:hypothetical protein